MQIDEVSLFVAAVAVRNAGRTISHEQLVEEARELVAVAASLRKICTVRTGAFDPETGLTDMQKAAGMKPNG